MVKYVVRLNPKEREQLLTLVNTGRAAAAKLLHARILLKADVQEGERCWTDAAIAEALETSPATVHRVRQAWVDQGMEAALARKPPTGRQYRKLDGAQEAQLVTVACSTPPAGRARWTLKLLAAKLVALDIVDTISPECVRTTLKKTISNRGRKSSG
jgi:transposase